MTDVRFAMTVRKGSGIIMTNQGVLFGDPLKGLIMSHSLSVSVASQESNFNPVLYSVLIFALTILGRPFGVSCVTPRLVV